MHSNMIGQGHVVETELLGEVKKEKYERSEFPNTEAYLNFGQSIDLVKKTQPGENPVSPTADFAADLRKTVSKKLAAIPNNFSYAPRDLQYFTAVGSHLDKFHRIDAFMEYADRMTGKKTRALIDITIDPTKEINPFYADQIVLITAPGDGLDKNDKDDQSIWNQLIEESGEAIVKQLLRGEKI